MPTRRLNDNRRVALVVRASIALCLRLERIEREYERKLEKRIQQYNDFLEYKRKINAQGNLQPKLNVTTGSTRSGRGLTFTSPVRPSEQDVNADSGHQEDADSGHQEDADSDHQEDADFGHQEDVDPGHQEDDDYDHQEDVDSGHQEDADYDHQEDVDSKKIKAGTLKNLLDNLDLAEENGSHECHDKSSEKGIKATRFQRFRRGLKSLKKRIVRSMKPLTSCFSLKSTNTAN
ncbi:hypothetical protein LOTGIDRAFT_238917 [Lottia gigantea]|uniref:Uncharacterized protein n=1 Tax=Lottia gigantea TaxID=225164 RepID=V4A577_LOTGI|nr:hypothetical protein LOTGIDRAFT_238917 [Lottia gigantea]ESO99073.1 hypothetical protein LOTGIDRAFT_238917 [Lottia gigantea]